MGSTATSFAVIKDNYNGKDAAGKIEENPLEEDLVDAKEEEKKEEDNN